MSRENPSQVSVKTVATITLTVLGIVFVAWFFWNTTGALLVTILALLVSVALNRVIGWLERHHVRRGYGIAIAMTAVAGLLVGLGFLFIPPVVTQVEQLVKDWPSMVASVQRTHAYRFLQAHLNLDQLIAHLKSRAPAAVGPALSGVGNALEAVAAAVTVLFVTLFMLAVGRQLVGAVLAQARPERRPTYARILADVYRALGGYVAGHLLIVLLQCTATTVFLALVGVPFFLPLGLLSGFASLIPFAGVTLIGTVVSLVAWGTHGLLVGIGTAVYYVVYQQFENHVLYPLVYRHTVEVNPLVIILAVLFLADWGGIPGAVLAVPLTAAAHIVVSAVLRARRERLEIPAPPPETASALHH